MGFSSGSDGKESTCNVGDLGLIPGLGRSPGGGNGYLPGSSPGGSRVIRRWGRSRRPGKNLFNYRYRGRLETDSVVGELVEKRGWITGLHGIPVTTYVGHRHLSILPKERRHWGLPGPTSEAQAELAVLVSTHISDGNSARKAESKKETTRGNQSFQKLIRFLYFSGLLIYFLLYIGMNTESRGGQQTWPLSQSGASYKIIQRSYEFHHLLAMRSADILWPFLILVS